MLTRQLITHDLHILITISHHQQLLCHIGILWFVILCGQQEIGSHTREDLFIDVIEMTCYMHSNNERCHTILQCLYCYYVTKFYIEGTPNHLHIWIFMCNKWRDILYSDLYTHVERSSGLKICLKVTKYNSNVVPLWNQNYRRKFGGEFHMHCEYWFIMIDIRHL